MVNPATGSFNQASACVSHSIFHGTIRQAQVQRVSIRHQPVSHIPFPHPSEWLPGLREVSIRHQPVSHIPLHCRDGTVHRSLLRVSIRHQPVSHIPLYGSTAMRRRGVPRFNQASACVSHSIIDLCATVQRNRACFNQASACVSHSIRRRRTTRVRFRPSSLFQSGISLCLTFHRHIRRARRRTERVSIRHQPVSHIPWEVLQSDGSIATLVSIRHQPVSHIPSDPVAPRSIRFVRCFNQASACVSHSMVNLFFSLGGIMHVSIRHQPVSHIPYPVRGAGCRFFVSIRHQPVSHIPWEEMKKRKRLTPRVSIRHQPVSHIPSRGLGRRPPNGHAVSIRHQPVSHIPSPSR